jgi:hypothetical protein
MTIRKVEKERVGLAGTTRSLPPLWFGSTMGPGDSRHSRQPVTPLWKKSKKEEA